MQIKDLRLEKRIGRVRAAATVVWEDCDRPTHDVFFETDEAFAEALSCNPHAFLVGCIIPAMHYGEKRICIQEPICPELRQGLQTAMSLLGHWFYEPGHPLVEIEAPPRLGLPAPRTPERAGLFFSGRIDSFATLRANRLDYPLQHSYSLKDGLLVYGLELDNQDSFQHVLDSLSKAAPKAGITLIPVYTNLYLNYRAEDARNHFSFWKYEFQGAVFAALAHAFARRLTVVSVASSYYLPKLCPYGTHPLLDPLYSSSDLRIRHDGVEKSRFAKTRLVAEWNVALEHLRVCNQYVRYRAGALNCGRCEKCLRTMLALVALGALSRASTFPVDDVTEALVLSTAGIDADVADFYQELFVPLAEIKRADLVRAIRRKLRPSREGKPGWKSMIRCFAPQHVKRSLMKLVLH